MAPCGVAEALMGDLLEEYELRRSSGSSAAASIWYMWQIFCSAVHLVSARITLRASLSIMARIGQLAAKSAFRFTRKRTSPEWERDLFARPDRWAGGRSSLISRLPAVIKAARTFRLGYQARVVPSGRSFVANAGAALTALCIALVPMVYAHQYAPGLVFGDDEKSYSASLGTIYANDRHASRRLVFGDGTYVVLNHGARMAVLNSEQVRYFTLLKGEATFTVKRPIGRSFDLTVRGRHYETEAGTLRVQLFDGGSSQLTVLAGEVSYL